MKKLFGDIDLTWKKLILFAIIAGVYTGLINSVDVLDGTSFRDIAISFEWWILFGIIIIMNSKNNLDSALKCFIFFLISQPLVYLVESPFKGIEVFVYYKGWFIWTLFTFPMGYIGYYLKKDKWWGLFILTPIILLLGIAHVPGFASRMIYEFPKGLLSYIFCIVTMIIYPLYIYKNKKIKTVGLIISIIVALAFSILGFTNGKVYETDPLCSGEEFKFDEKFNAYLEDTKYGEVSIKYEDGIEEYCVHAKFKHPGSTKLIIESPEKDQTVFDITIGDYTYDLIKVK